MNAAILEILISSFLGVNLKDIKKTFNKEISEKSESLEISERIDTVSKKLEDSKEIIENALFEINKQKKL